MKYVSVDIETTGLDPETCDVIEIGMVVDDTEQLDIPVDSLPTLRLMVSTPTDRPFYQGEPYALSMHSNLFVEISRAFHVENVQYSRNVKVEEAVWSPDVVRYPIEDFITKNFPGEKYPIMRRITVAGKNYASFDSRFLRKLGIEFRHRVLDPGMLFFDHLKDDKIPDFAECMRRAGLEPVVKHTAVEDAKDVIRMLRAAWATR